MACKDISGAHANHPSYHESKACVQGFSPLRVPSCLRLLEVFPPKAISQDAFEMEIEADPPQGKENMSLISGMILKTIKVSRLLSCT